MIGRSDVFWMKSRPTNRSSQIWMNCRTVTVAMAGIAMGTTSRQSAPKYPSPSTMPASMSSSGTPRKYVVNKNTENGVPSAA